MWLLVVSFCHMLKIPADLILKVEYLFAVYSDSIWISIWLLKVGAIAIILRFLIRENQIKSGKNQGIWLLKMCGHPELDAPSDRRPGGRGFNPRRGRQHSFIIDHEIFSTVILSLPLIQEGQLSVSGERMCTILVNCLEDEACPVNVWLGKLTALDMTPLGWLGCKTSTQTKLQIRWEDRGGNKLLFFLFLHENIVGIRELIRSDSVRHFLICTHSIIIIFLWRNKKRKPVLIIP